MNVSSDRIIGYNAQGGVVTVSANGQLNISGNITTTNAGTIGTFAAAPRYPYVELKIEFYQLSEVLGLENPPMRLAFRAMPQDMHEEYGIDVPFRAYTIDGVKELKFSDLLQGLGFHLNQIGYAWLEIHGPVLLLNLGASHEHVEWMKTLDEKDDQFQNHRFRDIPGRDYRLSMTDTYPIYSYGASAPSQRFFYDSTSVPVTSNQILTNLMSSSLTDTNSTP